MSKMTVDKLKTFRSGIALGYCELLDEQAIAIIDTAIDLYESIKEWQAARQHDIALIGNLRAENERLTAELFNESQGESSFKILQLTAENARLLRYERAWKMAKQRGYMTMKVCDLVEKEYDIEDDGK